MLLVACSPDEASIATDDSSQTELGRTESVADAQQPSLGQARPMRAEITGVYVIELVSAVDGSAVPAGFYTAQARLADTGELVNVYVPESTPVAYGALVEVRVDEGGYFLERSSQ